MERFYDNRFKSIEPLHLSGEINSLGKGDHGGVLIAVANHRVIALLVGDLALLQVALHGHLSLGALGIGVRGGVGDA